ncbi:integrating conjugative element protein [Legionella israelensis]|uniref:Integrating conjugative element protein n=1 Tax=Legionella israelensis TaxID=454 RepID=A0AAX1EI16_9GAMM|nr:integrating conjugative element protein [Legionella israelensis]QBR84683.1 integrating conjugative element protein [Legionella israelensis]
MRILLLMIISFKAFCLQTIPLVDITAGSNSQLDLSSPIGVPVSSKASVGKVTNQKIDTHLFHNAVFVIGADQLSQKWLTHHQQKLRDAQAIGFITNVDNFDIIIKLQEQTQLPLLPVNIDPLIKLLNISHYPFAITEGELWQ